MPDLIQRMHDVVEGGLYDYQMLRKPMRDLVTEAIDELERLRKELKDIADYLDDTEHAVMAYGIRETLGEE